MHLTFLKGAQRLDSYCISSQVGCAFGCSFCSTGAQGFTRNLTTEEITDQILYFKNLNRHIHSIAFMGMGEPLANTNHVVEAIEVFTDKDTFNISQRHISVSTIGIIPDLKILLKNFPNINISYSLHSAFPKERQKIMRIEKLYPLSKVFEVLDTHIIKTRRIVFIAYTLLKDVNDTTKHALKLANLIKSRPKSYLYHVRIIRFHPNDSLIKYEASSPQTTQDFINILTQKNISFSKQLDLGENLKAACGQLTGKLLQHKTNTS